MNTFARRPMLQKQIPLRDQPFDPDFKPRPLRDSDITALAEVLETDGFIPVRAGMIRDVVMLLADRNTYSPPAELIRSLAWDGKQRLSTFFIDYAGVIPEDEARRAYVEAVTRCFFISVVARIVQPGCKVDTMLVLEGPQGAKKSSLLRVIALRNEWFSDSLPHNLGSLDARQHLPGNLIVEMPEIAQFRRSELETVKAYLTCQHDKYRPSFGRFDIDWPRQNVFVGTTNTDDYLQDVTGNRRFWPLRTTTIRVEEAADVIEQIYAEAYQAFETGEQWWLPPEIEETAREEQADRVEEDAWMDDVATYVETRQPDFEGMREILVKDVLEHLGVPAENRRDQLLTKRIGNILRQLGGEKRQLRRHGKPQTVYRFSSSVRYEV